MITPALYHDDYRRGHAQGRADERGDVLAWIAARMAAIKAQAASGRIKAGDVADLVRPYVVMADAIGGALHVGEPVAAGDDGADR